MGKIKVLPKELAEKIAAGEVVERPASVVKELVENSLDAGSTMINVEVEDAGRSLIRVSDNGEGMTGEDMGLACRRHATSKISTAADLEGISTLGFRGEALPSIAAVSRLTVVSRSQSESTGWEVGVEGGVPGEVRQTAYAAGTTVAVRSLFFNTPARLKFLKSNATEISHIIRMVTELALAYPQTAFKLVHRKGEIINVAGGSSLKERAALLLGEETGEQLIPVSSELALVQINGLIARPGFGQSHRSNQFIFVNRRPVVNKTISHAVKQAYQTFLPERQFPPVIIFIETPPHTVDVNVHPTKREIKFRRPQIIHQALVKTARDALTSREHLPGLAVGSGTGKDTAAAAAPGRQPGLKTGYPSGVKTPEFPELFVGDRKIETLFRAGKKCEELSPVTGDYLQVKNTYIIIQDREGVVIIDQHAAHERILFDALLCRFRDKAVEKQRLAFALTLNLNKAQVVLMEEHRQLFQQLGFEVEPFGGDTYAIHSYPASLGRIDPVSVVEKTLAEIDEMELSPDLEKRVSQILAPLACHSAVRAGNRLPPEQIRSLLEQLWKTTAPHTCPHGRPTLIRISWSELEKKFRRK